MSDPDKFENYLTLSALYKGPVGAYWPSVPEPPIRPMSVTLGLGRLQATATLTRVLAICNLGRSRKASIFGVRARWTSKPYKFIGFGTIHGPKPYKFIGFQAGAENRLYLGSKRAPSASKPLHLFGRVWRPIGPV